jgi:hypothetical protein
MQNYMPIREFAICAIRILDDCSPEIRKVLKEEWYILNGCCCVNKKTNSLELTKGDDLAGFFGAGISVSAIVGINGSGKSSLLELIYRIVNNLGCLLTKGKRRRAAEQMYFVDGLCAELYYKVNGRLGVISCKGDDVSFGYCDDELATLRAFEGLNPS